MNLRLYFSVFSTQIHTREIFFFNILVRVVWFLSSFPGVMMMIRRRKVKPKMGFEGVDKKDNLAAI